MNRLVKSLYLVLMLVLPVAPAQAAGAVDELRRGPQVGAAIPHSLKAPDQNKQERDFKSLAHKRGLVILFSRSLDW